MTGAYALGALADWLDARQVYEKLSAAGMDAPEPELSEAALRVLRTYAKLESLRGKDVRRWATEAAIPGLKAQQ